MLPPPMPFKIFVLSAGVFGVPFRRFAATLVVARGLRYVFWGFMGATYGDEALALLEAFDAWFAPTSVVILSIFAAFVLVMVCVVLRQRRKPRRPAEWPSVMIVAGGGVKCS